eukprot:scaffold62333_cov24-Prasinocladus_malaysianus.AAC.1
MPASIWRELWSGASNGVGCRLSTALRTPEGLRACPKTSFRRIIPGRTSSSHRCPYEYPYSSYGSGRRPLRRPSVAARRAPAASSGTAA